jgi:GNAT superfamily N-acetyltransferase
VTDEGEGVAEVKSLAVEPSCQGRGYGRALLDFATQRYADTHEVSQVGTGDSPLTIPFYERCGFTRHHVVKDFFLDNYSRPIWESGIRLCDMVYLRKNLRGQGMAPGEGDVREAV